MEKPKKKIRMIGIEDLQKQVEEYNNLIYETNEVIAIVKEFSKDDHPHLIPESEFMDYVKYMILDMYDIPEDAPFVIDWEKTTKLVKETYNYIDYNDETYWYR